MVNPYIPGQQAYDDMLPDEGDDFAESEWYSEQIEEDARELVDSNPLHADQSPKNAAGITRNYLLSYIAENLMEWRESCYDSALEELLLHCASGAAGVEARRLVNCFMSEAGFKPEKGYGERDTGMHAMVRDMLRKHEDKYRSQCESEREEDF